MKELKEMDLYVEELQEDTDFTTLAFNCVACAFTVSSFSCPQGCVATHSSLSSATS